MNSIDAQARYQKISVVTPVIIVSPLKACTRIRLPDFLVKSISGIPVTAHARDWLRRGWRSWLFEIARVLVRLNHIASVIANADHSIV